MFKMQKSNKLLSKINQLSEKDKINIKNKIDVIKDIGYKQNNIKKSY